MAFFCFSPGKGWDGRQWASHGGSKVASHQSRLNSGSLGG